MGGESVTTLPKSNLKCVVYLIDSSCAIIAALAFCILKLVSSFPTLSDEYGSKVSEIIYIFNYFAVRLKISFTLGFIFLVFILRPTFAILF